MLLFLVCVAHAQEASTIDPPITVLAEPEPVAITAYALPAQDPAFLTDEAEYRTCTVRVTLGEGGAPAATAGPCPESMVEATEAATRQWRFDGPAGASFPVLYVLRYSAALGTTTLHAEVDPGLFAMLDGETGKPGLWLVHPPELARPIKTRVPRKARKAGVGTATCDVSVRVREDGRVIETRVGACPELLVDDATKRVFKSRWEPQWVDGMPREGVADVTLAYGK